MARRPLTINEIDEMSREEILAYQEARKDEIASEKEQKAEADDKARFEQQFLAAGGNKGDVDKEWKNYRREQAATAARRADQAAANESRRQMMRSF